LIKEFARDKDAVQSCVMIAEVAAYYKSRGMTLYEGLHELYQQYGCFLEGLQSMTLKGKEGLAQISAILSYFRNEPPVEVAGEQVSIIEDYQVSRR
ncbi:MAG TPA: phosphoglucomutase, partial [Paenibacillaceae bacterium]|nr:phosphoglucomutase [Paenibacillaceae bacterium]